MLIPSKEQCIFFLMLDASWHRPCFMSTAGITSDVITAFPIPRREGQELLKFPEEILCYADPTAQMSLSFKREKEAKTKHDHANPLTEKSKANSKGRCSVGYFTKRNISQVLQQKITRETEQLHGEPKPPSIVVQWITSIELLSIIWWIISCHMGYNNLKDGSSPRGQKGLHISISQQYHAQAETLSSYLRHS